MFRRIFLGLAWAGLSACQTTEQVHNRLVQAFDDVIFHEAPDKKGQSVRQYNLTLVRWNDPIHYAVIGDRDDPLAAMSIASLKKIAAVADVEVNAAEDPDDANFNIYLDETKDYVINGNESASCYAHTDSNDEGDLTLGEIHLPVARRQSAESCLDHEVLHAFGFRGHTHRIRSTISYVGSEDEWTRWDRILIRALYDPQMPPAAYRDEALDVAEMLIPELVETVD